MMIPSIKACAPTAAVRVLDRGGRGIHAGRLAGRFALIALLAGRFAMLVDTMAASANASSSAARSAVLDERAVAFVARRLDAARRFAAGRFKV